MKLGVAIEETWDFFNEVYANFTTCYETKLFARRSLSSGPFHTRINRVLLDNSMQRFLSANDVVFFEWASELLALASHMPKRCALVTRLHRYELYQWADRIHWEAVDRIILVSEAKRREFLARFPDQAPKIVVIPVGVDMTKFAYQPKTYGGNIGILCHLSPRKRVYETILTFAEVAAQDPQLHLHIAGGAGPAFRDYEEALYYLVEQLHLQDRVTFYGNVKDTSNWYHKIDIFLSNSFSEGLQVAPMEAMAMGCYVLSHRWHGADELVPPENLYMTDRELETKLLAYAALGEMDKRNLSMAMREHACVHFDVRDKLPQINQVVDEAFAGARKTQLASAGGERAGA
jgi:glycosyltransferase involved in cell wall biosynthesis